MLDSLITLDQEAMVLLNMGVSHNASWDVFFWMVSQIAIWAPALLSFLFVIIMSKGKEAIYVILTVVLLFALCDQISSSLLKPLIARPRPSHDPLVMDLLAYVNNYKGGAFGFPSSHAANSFGFAVFSSLLFRNKAYTVLSLLWAALCSYSRIYLGVHYPGDILFGTLLGIGVAFFCYWAMNKAMVKYPRFVTHEAYKTRGIYLVMMTLVVTLLVIGGMALDADLSHCISHYKEAVSCVAIFAIGGFSWVK